MLLLIDYLWTERVLVTVQVPMEFFKFKLFTSFMTDWQFITWKQLIPQWKQFKSSTMFVVKLITQIALDEGILN